MNTPSATPKIVVVIPARNEAENIGPLLESLPRPPVSTVIVCDNDSHDGTGEIARDKGAKVVHEKRRGYGSACLRAIEFLPPDTGIIVFLDADRSDDPAEMTRLLAPILADTHDLVIGSRTRRAEPGALMTRARFGNWLATRLIRVFWRTRYTDLGPFRAIRRASYESLGMCDPDMGWTVEMQIKAIQKGLRITEVDVSYRRRAMGESKITGTLMGTMHAGFKILWLVFRYGVFRK